VYDFARQRLTVAQASARWYSVVRDRPTGTFGHQRVAGEHPGVLVAVGRVVDGIDQHQQIIGGKAVSVAQEVWEHHAVVTEAMASTLKLPS